MLSMYRGFPQLCNTSCFDLLPHRFESRIRRVSCNRPG